VLFRSSMPPPSVCSTVVRAFEDGLLGLLRNQHSDILKSIRDSRDLDDATTAKLKGVVDAYVKTFA
jgi:F-type H+/Na+-transporting ATPase subunit alpha